MTTLSTPCTIAADIKRLCAKEFGVTVAQIEGKSRKKPIVLARHVAMYLLRDLAEWSLPRIGRAFGGRDHTTVLAAVVRAPERCRLDRKLIDRIQRVEFGLLRVG